MKEAVREQLKIIAALNELNEKQQWTILELPEEVQEFWQEVKLRNSISIDSK